MVNLKSLNLNFKFHLSFFKEKHVMPTEDLIFRIIQIFIAEFLGTLMLVFWGCASLTRLNDGETVIACWLWGNFVFLAIQIIGPISNCHINPAVTLSFFIYGYVSVVVGIVYILAQLAGATAGYAMLMAFGTNDDLSSYGFDPGESFCVTAISTDTPLRAAILEAFGTALLCLMIGRICNPLNPKGLTSISFVFSLAIMILGYSLVYWVGPLSGSLISSFLYHIFFLPKWNYVSDGTVEPADD